MYKKLLDKSLHIEEKHLYELDINDKFFDSLKEDYAEFVKWFKTKSQEGSVAYVTFNQNNISSFFMYKFEDEKEDYSLFSKPFIPKNRLKISTLKVSDTGKKIGKTYLEIIINKAIDLKVDEIYITLFDKQKHLINLLRKFGFKYYCFKNTVKSNGDISKEKIYVKKIK